jgi:hypothetical protein
MILGAVVDRPFVAGTVDKYRREDLQLLSALHALAKSGAGRHPLGVTTGDRPDRYLVNGSRVRGTELTQLTLDHVVREDLAHQRLFARRLAQRMQSRPLNYRHLQGRAVTLSKHFGERVPRDNAPLLSEIARALQEDRGYFAQGHDMSRGHARQLGDRGSTARMGLLA